MVIVRVNPLSHPLVNRTRRQIGLSWWAVGQDSYVLVFDWDLTQACMLTDNPINTLATLSIFASVYCNMQEARVDYTDKSKDVHAFCSHWKIKHHLRSIDLVYRWTQYENEEYTEYLEEVWLSFTNISVLKSDLSPCSPYIWWWPSAKVTYSRKIFALRDTGHSSGGWVVPYANSFYCRSIESENERENERDRESARRGPV